ncbi:nitrogen fixation protein NifQ [Hydrogenophaga soli]
MLHPRRSPGLNLPRTGADLSRALLACARHPTDPATQALAGVLSTRFERHGLHQLPLPGRDVAHTQALLARWFPGAGAVLGLDWEALAAAPSTEARADEIDDLVALLTAHTRPATSSPIHTPHATHAHAEDLAWALAFACLEPNHLWQDLHLPSRAELSQLMHDWFPTLAARNVAHMKWKKFLYKQLCERENLFICKSPSCQTCSDHPLCFGPETAQTTPWTATSHHDR